MVDAAVVVELGLDGAQAAPVRLGLARHEVDAEVGAVAVGEAVWPLNPEPDGLESRRAVLAGMPLERELQQPLKGRAPRL